jgi:hypothetical protein
MVGLAASLDRMAAWAEKWCSGLTTSGGLRWSLPAGPLAQLAGVTTWAAWVARIGNAERPRRSTSSVGVSRGGSRDAVG